MQIKKRVTPLVGIHFTFLEDVILAADNGTAFLIEGVGKGKLGTPAYALLDYSININALDTWNASLIACDNS
ncbi:1443_t:CDS:2 [Entrophospora sp. SA101]|nr:1443_t:CDS:2 [Entrophospora sp. SA101]CAJ0839575.1 14133_t:CDS:2 [Entrophospora sp. SA101]